MPPIAQTPDSSGFGKVLPVLRVSKERCYRAESAHLSGGKTLRSLAAGFSQETQRRYVLHPHICLRGVASNVSKQQAPHSCILPRGSERQLMRLALCSPNSQHFDCLKIAPRNWWRIQFSLRLFLKHGFSPRSYARVYALNGT